MKRFAGQVAIVTGGARGIGAGISSRLAAEGCIVYLLDRMADTLAEKESEMKGLGLQVDALMADITKEEEVESAFNKVYRKEGRLDIMVNSAGIIGPTSTNIAEYDAKSFDRVIDVNVKGAFLTTKYALPPMIEQNYGRILHLSSIGGKEGNPGMVGYVTGKSAIMGLVKAVGKEYARSGITVNGLAPAVIATPMNLETDQRMLEYMKAKIPMARLGTIEEVASLACWIVSKEASFNTGVIFDISGGRATF